MLAYHEETGELGYYPVTKLWKHAGDELVLVTLEGETIETTVGHPFYVDEVGWLDAGDLQVGMDVWQADGTTGTVDEVTFESTDAIVYNLTVADSHTFFVGYGEWLVHNCGGNRLQYDSSAVGPHTTYRRDTQLVKSIIMRHMIITVIPILEIRI